MINAVLILALAAYLAASATTSGRQPYPEPVDRPQPVYPFLGEIYDVTAACSVVYDVTPAGETAHVCAVCAISHDLPPLQAEMMASAFNTAAEEAVARWRFEPSETGAAGYLVKIDFRFSDEDIVPDWPDHTPCMSRPIARALTPERGLA